MNSAFNNTYRWGICDICCYNDGDDKVSLTYHSENPNSSMILCRKCTFKRCKNDAQDGWDSLPIGHIKINIKQWRN